MNIPVIPKNLNKNKPIQRKKRGFIARAFEGIFFKVTATQIVVSVAATLLIFIFFLLQKVSKLPIGRENAAFMIGILTIGLLLSRLSILTQVGIGFNNLILTAILLVYGLLPALGMIFVTTFIFIQIANQPTSFDFLINKGIGSAIAQTIYLSLWAITLTIVYYFVPLSYITANIVFVYMIGVVIYVTYMIPCLLIFRREPLPSALMNGMMTLMTQAVIITYLGSGFLLFMMGA